VLAFHPAGAAVDRNKAAPIEKNFRGPLDGGPEICKIERSFDFPQPPPSPAVNDPHLHPVRDSAGPQRALQKGQQTRAAILDAALALAANIGLEGLSIGALADVTRMSKSGVFAHFGSREELQISVVREYHAKFADEVFFPALRELRGLPRVKALFERWVRRVSAELDSGCIYISGAVEFDDRPGPVRDALVAMVQDWQSALERAVRLAVDAGHLAKDTDPLQLVFELHGLILALHHDARFLRNAGAIERVRVGFERLVSDCATPAGMQILAGGPRAAARSPRKPRG
jgi:AcrR family transcriptional regulator